MFFYVYGIKSLAEAQAAVAMGANAVGVNLSYDHPVGMTENYREIFATLPEDVQRVGIFAAEPCYIVEELATFCNLDVLQFLSPRGDLTRYLQTVYSTDWDSDANFWTIRFDADYTLEKIKGQIEKKHVILIGENDLEQWQSMLLALHPYGAGIHVRNLTPELAALVKSI